MVSGELGLLPLGSVAGSAASAKVRRCQDGHDEIELNPQIFTLDNWRLNSGEAALKVAEATTIMHARHFEPPSRTGMLHHHI
jgi:hypothetical protein